MEGIERIELYIKNGLIDGGYEIKAILSEGSIIVVSDVTTHETFQITIDKIG